MKAALDGAFASEGDALGDSFLSIEGLAGTAFGDLLRGHGGANALAGGAGNDTLQGAAGNDVLNGGSGGDQLAGGDGFDFASYAGSAQAVRVALDGSLAATGDALGDTFNTIDALQGTGFNDLLRGDANVNVLLGGIGNDCFDFTALTQGGDMIGDFSNAAGNNDALRFEGDVFGGLALGALAGKYFAANDSGTALTADQHFLYETDTGILRYDANGSGPGGVTVIATLTGAPPLTAADIVIL